MLDKYTREQFLERLEGSDSDWPALLPEELIRNHLKEAWESVIFDGGKIYGDGYAGPTLSALTLWFDKPVDGPRVRLDFCMVTIGYSEGYQCTCFETLKDALASSGRLRAAIEALHLLSERAKEGV